MVSPSAQIEMKSCTGQNHGERIAQPEHRLVRFKPRRFASRSETTVMLTVVCEKMKQITATLMLILISACSRVPDHMKELTNPVVEAKVEARLAKWQADHDDLRPSLGALVVTNADPTGEWKNHDMAMESNTMTVRRLRGGQYEVLFSTQGCVDYWTLTRQAAYSNGIFQMSRPVEEYSGAQYDTLYTLTVSNGTVLLPQSAARTVESGSSFSQYPKAQRTLFLGRCGGQPFTINFTSGE